jgi:predicted small lipoprotein YifL
MRYLTLAPLAVLLVLVATGCGSKGGPSYTLAPTEKCLNAAGHKAYPTKNPILTGSQGNLEVDFGYGTESIYIVFGKNSSEATTIENRAITQTELNEHIGKAQILAGVTVDKNVFYYSDRGPLTVVGRQEISSCLK